MKKVVLSVVAASCIMSVGAVTFASEMPMAVKKEKNDGVKVEAQYFTPSLSFRVKTDSISYNGGNVDFKNDLGMDAKNAPGFRVTLNENLRVDYMQMGLSGNTTLTQNLQYEGKNYQVGTNAQSDLDMAYARVTWVRPISKSPTMKTNWMIDLKAFKFDTKVTGTETGTGLAISQSKDFKGAIPTIGFEVEADLDKTGALKGFGEISGLPLGKYGNFYDLSAGLAYQPDQNLTVKAGYRVFNLDVKNPDKDENALYKMSGPFYAVEYRF